MEEILNKFEKYKNQVFFVILIVIFYSVYKQNMTLKMIQSDFKQSFDYFKNQQTAEKAELKNQLSLLREELIKYKSQQEGRDQMLALSLNKNQDSSFKNLINQADELTASISALNQSSIKGILKLKNNWSKAEVYSEAKASSKILGEIYKDKLYFIYEKISGWYKIEYENGLYGWVQASLVEEL